jgi:nicotinamidase-related amidase
MRQLPAPTRDPYIGWRRPLSESELRRGDTALIVVDMQYFDADWESGIVLQARQAGFEKDLLYYRDRLALIVPNIRRLQDACRAKGLEVIHTKIVSLTADGRDRFPIHKELGFHASSDSRNAEILEELRPVGDEMVFTKTNSSVFNGTIIDRVLRNMRIKNLIFTGVVTTGCVETAVRDAADLGYACTLVEDACGAMVEEMHWASVRVLRNVYARIETTDQIVNMIEEVPA